MSTPRRATVTAGDMVAPGVRRVRLRMLDGSRLGHRAGQYILLHARGEDGTIVKRAYSIATPPADDPSFELCVRLIPGQPASGYVHALTPGTEVSFSGPWGKFVVDDPERDLTLVATGSAISCTGAIVEDELAKAGSRRVRFLWGLRHAEDVHTVGRLEALARAHSRFSYLCTLSQPGPGWSGARGRVTEALRPDARSEGLYYLAGNGAMIVEAEELLQEHGVSAESIRKEPFFTPGQVRVPLRERQVRTANLARSGRAVVGVALHAGADGHDVAKAIEEALALATLSTDDVRNIAAAVKASDEPGLTEAAATLQLPLEFYLPTELEAAGLPVSGCESLARISAGGSTLILPKHKTATVTVAIAAVGERA